MKIKKLISILIAIFFLCQSVAFCIPDKNFILRPPSHFNESTEAFIIGEHSRAKEVENGKTLDEVVRFGNKSVRVITFEELEAVANRVKDGARKNYHYFKTLKIEDGSEIIIYIAENEMGLLEPIDRDTTWNRRQEINVVLSHEAGIETLDASERERIILEVVTRANMIKLGPGAGPKDVLREFFKNCQKKFEETVGVFVSDLLKGKDPDYDVSRYADTALSDPAYSHITHFSWIYAVEIIQLIKLLRAKENQRLAVVDNGTGFGHFILTTAYVLRRLEEKGELPTGTLERIHFIGTDHKLKDIEFAIEAGPNYPGLSVSWELLDINASDYPERVKMLNNGNPVSLIVTNHVLEHLDAKPTIDYMSDWLQIGECSVVSVPLEDSLALSISSHTGEFTEDSLRALAEQIKNMSEGNIKFDLRYLDGGVLMLWHENFELTKPATGVLLENDAFRILNSQL